MLPLGVLLKKLADDPAGRNRLLGAALVAILLVGAFATGLSIDIRFGSARDDRALQVTSQIDPLTGEEVFVDGEGNVLDEQAVADLGLSASTSAPTGGTSGTATRPAGSAPAPAAGQAAAPAPGAAPTTAPSTPGQAAADPCEGARLGETDQGVTAETIKLGVLVPNLNELELAGFPVGLAGDFDAITDAWLNEFNRTGVACRQVTWVKRVFDVTDGDDMQRVCREMTQDEKVFSVITPGGFDSVAQLCIAKDAKTPLINAEAEPAEWYVQAQPYLWNLATSKDRGHVNHVRWLVDNGVLGPDDTIGVIYDGTPHVAPATEKGLLPELARQGLEPAEVFELSSDTEQALGQINSVVIDFQLAGVDFVFMPMNLIYKTQFMTSAEQQGYFPQYTESDHNFGCYDFTTGTYPERSYQDTICVTTTDVIGRVDLEEYTDAHPFAQYADRVYFDTHGEGSYHPDGPGSDGWDTQRALHVSLGSMFRAWELAADRVGPDITRAKWGASMAQTGAFDQCVCESPLFFGPDKFDGATTVKGLIWKAEASEGYPERTYRELTRPREAYVQRFAP